MGLLFAYPCYPGLSRLDGFLSGQGVRGTMGCGYNDWGRGNDGCAVCHVVARKRDYVCVVVMATSYPVVRSDLL